MSVPLSVLSWDDAGAPSPMTHAIGQAEPFFDAVLVDGYNSVPVTSLVVSGGVATATSTGHGFRYEAGIARRVRIEGATPAGLNGDHLIMSVADANTLTFATAEADTTATGTITAKTPPVGEGYWSKAFTNSTDKAAYLSSLPLSHGMYLRLYESESHLINVRGYFSMTGIDTGSEWPLYSEAAEAGVLEWTKTDSTSTEDRRWYIVGDGRRFHLFVSTDGLYPTSFSHYFFGDVLPANASDTNATILVAGYNSVYSQPNYLSWFHASRTDSSTGIRIARNYGGTTTGEASYVATAAPGGNVNNLVSGGGSTGSLAYPNAPSGEIYLGPTYLLNDDANDNLLREMRGSVPGYYFCSNDLVGTKTGKETTLETVSGISGLSGKTLLMMPLGGNSADTPSAFVFIDVTGPWE